MEELKSEIGSEQIEKKKLWNKDFILLLQGSVVSTIGDMMYSVAIGYWVYEKTGSNSLMGIMSAISMLVTMVLSPFSGSIIDKCNRKWILVGMDLLQSVIMITVGILAFMDKLNVAGVLIAALLAALGTVFYSPAVNTVILDIIPHDDLVRGESVFSGATSFVNMIGTAFSGVMVAFFGVPLIIVINGLSNLYSAISEYFIKVPRTVKQGTPVTVKGLLKDNASALKVIFSDKVLRLFIPCALIINLLAAGPLVLVLPFTLEKGFSVDKYGYIMSVWTAATIASVLILSVVKFSPKARYLAMVAGFCGTGIFLSAAYLSTNFVFICVFAGIGAFLNVAGNTIFNAAMKLALPEENRGAILGFINSASVGGSAISVLMYGFLGDVFPLYIVFTVGTIISLVPMMYMCLNSRTKNFILTH